MKTLRVKVRFPHGLHARPAARLVHLFRAFRSSVFLRVGNRVANAGSLMSILLLSATFDSQLEVQASGEDEDAAIQAAEVFFQSGEEIAVQQIQNREPPVSPSARPS
jgi:phosphotransferase system HPr (HPr) family protein